MSDNLRRHMEKVPSSQLREMWAEVEAWETTGVLAEDAWVRRVAEVTFVRFPNTPNILHFSLVASEVWRETAGRLLQNGGDL